MRRGWTLHEMIISLAVTGGVLALAVHAALGQLRFFHGVGEIANVRGQLGQSTMIVRALLWGASPAAGDIAVAQDTALELNVVIGTAAVCESAPGWVIVPGSAGEANALASFAEAPQPDDRIAALLEDSTGATWITLRVASPPTAGAGCARFPSAPSGQTIALVEQVALPAGTPLRVLRPMRLSVYRASDGRWYLGARDWNATTQRFNTIQPVAGPLEPPTANAATSGFRFEYLDAGGSELVDVVDPRVIAGVRVIARATSGSPVRIAGMATVRDERVLDSAVTELALRNAR